AGDGNSNGSYQMCAKAIISAGDSCSNALAICPPLPFQINGLTTQGKGNEYGEALLCHSEYMSGQDFVFSYTPPVTQCVDIAISGTGLNTYPGLFLLSGCPNDTSSSYCLASATN